MRVETTARFEKALKQLHKSFRSVAGAVAKLTDQLSGGKLLGDRIVGTTRPAYKVRLPNRDANRGKSGGSNASVPIPTLPH